MKPKLGLTVAGAIGIVISHFLFQAAKTTPIWEDAWERSFFSVMAMGWIVIVLIVSNNDNYTLSEWEKQYNISILRSVMVISPGGIKRVLMGPHIRGVRESLSRMPKSL